MIQHDDLSATRIISPAPIPPQEADWAAKQLPADANVSDGIRQALKLLSKA